MPLITLILVMVVIGVVMYLINTYVPMDPRVKRLLNWTVILLLIIWVLQLFGLLGYLGVVTVPRIH